MTPEKLNPKTAAEILTYTFNFSGDLGSGELLIGGASVTCTPYIGNDANSQAMVSGSAQCDLVDGLVLQSFDGGLPVVDYLLSCKMNTNQGRVLEGLAILPVR